MAIRHVPPKGIWPGINIHIGSIDLCFLAHTWQCGQRFTGIKTRRSRNIGYQTYGDASPTTDARHSGGWYWLDDYFTKRGLKHTFVEKGLKHDA